MRLYPLLPFFAAALLFAGCNTAELQAPPPIDGGPPCPTAPIVVCPDAGAAAAACGADPSSKDVTLAQVPAGDYAMGCVVKLYQVDKTTGECIGAGQCACGAFEAGAPRDAGPAPDGGDAGSVTTDAGPAPLGAWSCSR